MTHPTHYCCQPGPESGRAHHTQESGDDGLSSLMAHKFSDNYDDSALSVAAKDTSFVRPIPKDEQDVFDGPAITGKIWSHPLVFGHGASPKARPAGEEVIKPSTLAVVQNNYFPPQVKNNPEGETVIALPGTAAITEGQPDVEVEAEESCTKMENPAKPEDPPLERRNSSHRRKRAAGKYRKMYLLYLMTFMHLPVSGSFPAGRCFTCMDMDRCPKLMKIFHPDDTRLYHRDLNETFPECSETSSPGPKNCAVCRSQSNIHIICLEDAGSQLEVEGSDGKVIGNITSVCVPQQQTPARTRIGMILSIAFFVIVVGALLIYICCKGKRIGLKVVSTEEH